MAVVSAGGESLFTIHGTCHLVPLSGEVEGQRLA